MSEELNLKKIKAYELIRQGMDMHESPKSLGFYIHKSIAEIDGNIDGEPSMQPCNVYEKELWTDGCDYYSIEKIEGMQDLTRKPSEEMKEKIKQKLTPSEAKFLGLDKQ